MNLLRYLLKNMTDFFIEHRNLFVMDGIIDTGGTLFVGWALEQPDDFLVWMSSQTFINERHQLVL